MKAHLWLLVKCACVLQEWNGRVTYHQELWVFPSLLLFHSDISRHIIASRRRTIRSARQNAEAIHRHGAMIPWESGVTGISCSPNLLMATSAMRCWSGGRHGVAKLSECVLLLCNAAQTFVAGQLFRSLLVWLCLPKCLRNLLYLWHYIYT